MAEILSRAPEEVVYREVVDEIYERKIANPGFLGHKMADKAVFVALNVLKHQKKQLADQVLIELKNPMGDTESVWSISSAERVLGSIIENFEVKHDPRKFPEVALEISDRFVGTDIKQALFWAIVGFASLSATPDKRN